MDDDAVLAVLARADATGSLPRLGGMARPNGVAIVSERIWCFSGTDGSTRPVAAMPQAPAPLQRVPLFRGIVKLVGALTPLVGRGSAAPLRGRILLAAALAAPLALPLLPGPYRSPALGVVTIALVASILRGRTLNLHGAEHRAIAAAEAGSLVATWRGAARPSRYSPRCGTNFAALLIPVAMLLDRFWLLPTTAFTPVLVTVAAVTLTMEIWLAAQRTRFARVVVLPGLALQRLTTREPTLVETRVALRAVAAVLDHHAAS